METLVVCCSLVVMSVSTRAAQSPPSFEIASVKANRPDAVRDGGRGTMLLQPDGRFTATHITLRELIRAAYQTGVDRRDVIGGPPWINSDRFDVVAKAEGNHVLDADGRPRRTWLMVRALLEDRFKLKIHEEIREQQPIYALVIARENGALGPQLRKSDVDCVRVLDDLRNGRTSARQPERPPPCSVGPEPGRITATAMTMSQLASLLSARVGRHVVDRTGLAGNFDWHLEFAPLLDHSSPPETTVQTDRGPSIFTALQEQLGLKLESTRGRVSVLVVDEAHRPTPD